MNKDEVIVSYLYRHIVGFRELSFYIFNRCPSFTSPINDIINKDVIKLIFDRHVLFAWNQFSNQCFAQKHFLFKVRVNLKQLTICIWIINISIIDSLNVWWNFSLIQFYKTYVLMFYHTNSVCSQWGNCKKNIFWTFEILPHCVYSINRISNLQTIREKSILLQHLRFSHV